MQVYMISFNHELYAVLVKQSLTRQLPPPAMCTTSLQLGILHVAFLYISSTVAPAPPQCSYDHHNLISDRDLANATTLTRNEEFIHKVMQFHGSQIHGDAHMKWIACGALKFYITVAYHMMLKKSTQHSRKRGGGKAFIILKKPRNNFRFLLIMCYESKRT